MRKMGCGYKKIVLALIIGLISFSCLYAKEQNVRKAISVLDYGAVPDDGKDDTKALRKAVDYCRANSGTILMMPAGEYRLRDDQADALEKKMYSGKYPNPEKEVFVPYYPHVKGLNFDGAESITIEAKGAVLMCEGWMEPLSILNCKNFTINGLTIDYKQKAFSQGIVKSVGEESFTVQFDDRRQITNEIPITRLMFWDNELSGIHHKPYYHPKRKLLGNNLVEFKCKISKHLEGAFLSALHSFHFRPAILIQGSLNTILNGVTIHSQPGMGIVGFDSKDITLNHLSVEPAAGYMFSTNTDATHFACCEGVLKFDNCFFRGQGDDATNVHGYYHNITSVAGNQVTLELAGINTHASASDVPRVGDKLELVRISTLAPERELEVLEVAHKPKSNRSLVRLKGELPDNFKEYYVCNVSKLPRVEFCNSVVWGQLARGVLIKTRGVKIANNVFKGCTGTAIHIGAESFWKEGSHAKDVTITDNLIVNCGLGAGCIKGASGIAVAIEAPDTENTILHEGIRITGNTIIGSSKNKCGIMLRNVRHVELQDNRIEGCQNGVLMQSVENIQMK